MKNYKINSIQLGSLIVGIILSANFGIGLYNSIQISKVNSYINIFISCILGFIPILLIIYIAHFKEEKNIIEKINILFGKYLGKIINFSIVIILFIIAITTIFTISNFIITQFLSNTPVIYIGIMFGLIIIYSINKGIETISRTQFIFMFIVITIYIILFFSLCFDFDFDNLKPYLEYGIKEPIKASIISIFTNFIPLFTILIIPKNNIIDKDKYNKFFIIFYIISSIFIFLLSLLTIGVLGEYLSVFYQYPEYILLKKVSLFGFIDRIENFLSIGWILCSFTTITFILYYITMFFQKKENAKIPSIIITISTILFANFIFKNNTYFNNYITNIYPYILSILFILIIIICIKIYMYNKK